MFILLKLPFKVFVLKKSGAVKLTAHKIDNFKYGSNRKL